MVIKSLRRSKDGLKAAVRRLQSGIFSLLSGLRSLTAEAHYLLGKTRRKNPGKRPSASISPSGRRQENQPLVFIHFLSFAGLNSTRKRSKRKQKSQTHSDVIPVG